MSGEQEQLKQDVPLTWIMPAQRRHKSPTSVSVTETRLLRLIAQDRLVRTFVGGAEQYSVNGMIVPARFAKALIKKRAVLPLDEGLLPDSVQSWRARNPSDGAAPRR